MIVVSQAVILVGGKGTRLRPITTNVPKPVLDVVDRPFLVHMLDWLARHGITEAVLCCGFQTDVLVERLGDHTTSGVSITYVDEPEPLGTAGALKFAEAHLHERFVMVNGDLLTDLDLSAQIADHERSGLTGTLGLVAVEDPSAFGLVRTDEDGTVKGFVEKPKPEEIDTDLISAGCYVLERSVLDLIPGGRNVSIEREVFPRLVGNGLAGFPHRGAYFMDLGTPERYLDGVRDVLTGALPTETHAALDADGLYVDAGATVEGTVAGPGWIAAGAQIAAGASVSGSSVIAAGAQIGAGTEVRGSVVLPGARIGERALLDRVIVGPSAIVGDGATLRPLAVIGPHATVAAGAEIATEAKVEADVEVPDAR